MPRIFLKDKSPEFDDEGKKPQSLGTHSCDMPGCQAEGQHKAPKDRNLSDYYWFCLEHVQEYNKAWDFFSGMSADEIENHIRRSFLWDRPTRRFDSGDIEDRLRHQARKTRFFDEDDSSEQKKKGEGFRFSSDPNIHATPEMQALAIMGLEPPLDIQLVKTRYKQLVKQYHPDVNPDDPKAEDTIKSINMAYTILKVAYEKYEKEYGTR